MPCTCIKRLRAYVPMERNARAQSFKRLRYGRNFYVSYARAPTDTFKYRIDVNFQWRAYVPMETACNGRKGSCITDCARARQNTVVHEPFQGSVTSSP
eukprot:6178174-Pleurochrysis_carterae.AAC.2